MFESRCGICCRTCSRKEEVNCSGCLSMKVPFWGGQCDVKTCCEHQGCRHCGVCPSFPCELVASLGKEQGFDPTPRLAQCRAWAQEEEAETVALMMTLGLL